MKLLKKVIIPGAGNIPTIVSGVHTKVATTLNSKKTPAASRLAAPIPNGSLTNKLKKASSKSKATSSSLTLLSERTLASGQKLKVFQADITNVSVDAIVHPTNNVSYYCSKN